MQLVITNRGGHKTNFVRESAKGGVSAKTLSLGGTAFKKLRSDSHSPTAPSHHYRGGVASLEFRGLVFFGAGLGFAFTGVVVGKFFFAAAPLLGTPVSDFKTTADSARTCG